MFGISYCKAWAAAVSARLWTLCRFYGRIKTSRCGRICRNDVNKGSCDCCGSEAYHLVPEKYWDEGEIFMREEQKELLWEELVKTSPVFDEDLFNRRDDIITSQVNSWIEASNRVDAFVSAPTATLRMSGRSPLQGGRCLPVSLAWAARRSASSGTAISAAVIFRPCSGLLFVGQFTHSGPSRGFYVFHPSIISYY